ncbi:MFS transporter [Sphingomonas sp. KR1UV-12]|uniref:MFS transporter n=1 Tax=Sphingomonas aurea TaxID=3063994 RepID=A0ABT9ELB1_9SPHN|nr:MFS transporter [Sphingomonas sp. KR1UV-12]MDP1027622.1 MFS transporter [Sphingomonas sp. KR1UV-12]
MRSDTITSSPDGIVVPTLPPARNVAAGAVPTRFPLGIMLMMMLIYTLNFFDRQILTILVEPIKADLLLSDGQIGAITGLAFAILYTAAGMPLAWLADRTNRVRLIAVALAVWSVFTIACGFTRSFGQLLLTRVGVGVGEAGCTPAAHSLITEYVPRERRALALAMYQMGVPLGSLTGLAVGGLLVSSLGWRWAFFLAGAPGLVLAAIVPLVMHEPRGNRAAIVPDPVPLGPGLKTLWRRKSFVWICIGSGFSAFAFYGLSAFSGSLYLRTHATELAAMAADASMAPTALLGIVLGLIVGVMGGLGTFLGGFLSDRVARGNIVNYVLFCAVALTLAAPLFAGAALAGGLVLSFAFFGGALFCQTLSYGPVYAAIQTVAEPRMRGMAVALQLLVVNLVGLALGPLFVGMTSDHLTATLGPIHGLRSAIALVAVPMLLSGLMFTHATRLVRREDATFGGD